MQNGKRLARQVLLRSSVVDTVESSTDDDDISEDEYDYTDGFLVPDEPLEEIPGGFFWPESEDEIPLAQTPRRTQPRVEFESPSAKRRKVGDTTTTPADVPHGPPEQDDNETTPGTSEIAQALGEVAERAERKTKTACGIVGAIFALPDGTKRSGQDIATWSKRLHEEWRYHVMRTNSISKSITYIGWQLEIAPKTGEPHLQYFAATSKSSSGKRVGIPWTRWHQSFPHATTLRMRGTLNQCIDYVVKEQTRSPLKLKFFSKNNGVTECTSLRLKDELEKQGLLDARPDGKSSEFNRVCREICNNPRLILTHEITKNPEFMHQNVRCIDNLYKFQQKLLQDRQALSCPFTDKKPFVVWCSGPPGCGKTLFAKLAAYDPQKWLCDTAGRPLGNPAYDGPRITEGNEMTVTRRQSRAVLEQFNRDIPEERVTLKPGDFSPLLRKQKTHDKWFSTVTCADQALIIDEFHPEMWGSPTQTCKAFFGLAHHGTFTGEIKGGHVNMKWDLIIVTAPQTCKQMWEGFMNDNPRLGLFDQWTRRINLEKNFGQGIQQPRSVESFFN